MTLDAYGLRVPVVEHPTGRPNFTRIDVGAVAYWYSYTTLVGVRVAGSPATVRRNVWSTTTGRHLNLIDGGEPDAKRARVDDLRPACALALTERSPTTEAAERDGTNLPTDANRRQRSSETT